MKLQKKENNSYYTLLNQLEDINKRVEIEIQNTELFETKIEEINHRY